MAEGSKKVQDDDDDVALGEGGIRALRSEREENRKLRAEIQKLKDAKQEDEDSKLKDAEKWQRKYEQVSAELKSLQSANEQAKLRQSIAKEFKDEGIEIPESLITGEDEAAMRASAEQLKEFAQLTGGPRRPQPTTGLGRTEDETTKEDGDAEALRVLGFGDLM